MVALGRLGLLLQLLHHLVVLLPGLLELVGDDVGDLRGGDEGEDALVEVDGLEEVALGFVVAVAGVVLASAIVVAAFTRM